MEVSTGPLWDPVCRATRHLPGSNELSTVLHDFCMLKAECANSHAPCRPPYRAELPFLSLPSASRHIQRYDATFPVPVALPELDNGILWWGCMLGSTSE